MSKNSKISNLSPANGPTRIVHDQANAYQTWSLPTFDEHDGHIIESAEKQQQDKAAAEVQDNELVEDVVETVAPLTAAELDEITRTAQKEGYQVGYDEGHGQGLSAGMTEGLAKGEDEIRQKLEPELQRQAQLFSQIGKQMSTTFAQQQTDLQPLLMDMVIGLAAQFIQTELQVSPKFLVGLINDAIEALPANGEDILIEINPEQRSLIAEHTKIEGVEWELKDNSALGSWDCKVSTSVSQIKLDFQQRWQSLIEQFRAGRLMAQEIVVEEEQEPEFLSAANLFSSPDAKDQDTTELEPDVADENSFVADNFVADSEVLENKHIDENIDVLENNISADKNLITEKDEPIEEPKDASGSDLGGNVDGTPPIEQKPDDGAAQSNLDANIPPE